jgi:hypothetical protein
MVYPALRRVLALVVLRFRSRQFKELEIVVLGHELEILRRQAGRPQLRPADRVFLAAATRVLPWCRWRALFVTPDTLLRWHRQLVARNRRAAHASVRVRPTPREICETRAAAGAREPELGLPTIAGEAAGLGLARERDRATVRTARRRLTPTRSDRAGRINASHRHRLRVSPPCRAEAAGATIVQTRPQAHPGPRAELAVPPDPARSTRGACQKGGRRPPIRGVQHFVEGLGDVRVELAACVGA